MAKLWKPNLAAKPKPEDLDKLLPLLRYPLLGSPKYDGIRVEVQNGKLYSRSLKLIPNLAMQKLWGRKELNGLDGEIIVGPATASDCFNRSTSAVMSRDKLAEDAVFNVFDRFSDDAEPFDCRLEDAEDVIEQSSIGAVRPVKHILLRNLAQLLAYEAKETGKGHEGIMLRDPNGVYKQGRSTLKEGGLIAVKRFVEIEAFILDIYEQNENTNEQKENELGKMKRSSHKAGKVGKGTLGGFHVRPLIQDGEKACNYVFNKPCDCHPIFKVAGGPGLTNALRDELWAKRDSLVGKIVKVRYQLIGTMDKPRIPQFLGFRDERDL